MTTEQPGVQRRTVLAAGGLVIVGGALAACSGSSSPAATPEPASAPVSAPGVQSAAVEAPVAGALAAASEIPVGGGVISPEPPIVITQPAAGTFKAFTAICPHQGCLVAEVSENQIVCPCHGSIFSAEDGSVIQGPAEQGLTVADIVLQGDSIVLA